MHTVVVVVCGIFSKLMLLELLEFMGVTLQHPKDWKSFQSLRLKFVLRASLWTVFYSSL